MKEIKILPYYSQYGITNDKKIIHIDSKEEVEQTYCNKDNTYKVILKDIKGNKRVLEVENIYKFHYKYDSKYRLEEGKFIYTNKTKAYDYIHYNIQSFYNKHKIDVSFFDLMRNKETLRQAVIDGEIYHNYFVSNRGHVYRRYGAFYYKWLKPTEHKGYLRITVYKDKVARKEYIHRIVAETYRNTYKNKFDSNGNIRNEVDHINVDTFDNRAGNLQWVSSSENGLLMNIRKNIVNRKKDSSEYTQFIDDLRVY
ncbi:hypothetical protein [Mammaliicoccus sciuri]|uniref:hypothetical protein n=1 Tax=Mammaliicoccus sciuri TaxID=1296 RepID=UPI003F57CC14